MNMDILAFGAHPDDVEISCGGTLLRYADEGKQIAIVDLTQGELGTRGSGALRMEECKAASQILGLVDRVNLGMADGFFEENEDHLHQIIREIRHFRPKLILANSIRDRHPDHGRAAALVARAAFLSGLPKINTERNGISQEAYRAPMLLHYIQDMYIEPDVVLDVSAYAEEKIKLVQSFSSQFFDPNSTEPETPISNAHFFEFMKGRMLQFGRPIGAKYAEGFTVNRTLGVSDLFHLI
ncbi:MAG: bacillithiol biosynthesis deacetylase BshB1 [Cryomorphaceae bacterium]|jgi:bacillithiol biosynthesis deacetylase BshB1|nr:bacillithiol biosynthesis deacetylase BshB1 [Cryomorphaceae bacterium]